ncbi:MAG TPA: dTDP-4-dehydrorhamnose 3,5-epimerase [Allosphingosinicella sp.]|nr:dTDP-4-dehydrorhamnose 3,5-epimerase [Allosphingosinicella sp.]
MVEVRPLGLDGVFEIRPPRFGDERGFFSETYSAPALAEAGIDIVFVQDNHSVSAARGVLRGLHYQLPPSAQDKLVRVTRGSVYDAVVDIRRGSPTFGRWVGLVLSAELWNQILVPKGFAHGFVTLEEGCEVQYKVSAPYDRAADRAIRFDDPAIAIHWPVEAGLLTLSPKDEAAPRLAEADIPDSWS